MGVWEDFVYRLLANGVVVCVFVPLTIILLGWLIYIVISIYWERNKK